MRFERIEAVITTVWVFVYTSSVVSSVREPLSACGYCLSRDRAHSTDNWHTG
ncbi:MAG: hypothetical protein KME27_26130 [Lyngbya sp. HA4199-MV5]|nr:hypothetical protein [Lyngbya sp. HA4199-MV5]